MFKLERIIPIFIEKYILLNIQIKILYLSINVISFTLLIKTKIIMAI